MKSGLNELHDSFYRDESGVRSIILDTIGEEEAKNHAPLWLLALLVLEPREVVIRLRNRGPTNEKVRDYVIGLREISPGQGYHNGKINGYSLNKAYELSKKSGLFK